MECTVDVKKLPAEIIVQLKDNLQKLKLFRASNEMLLNTYNKEWRELFDELQPVAQAAITEIDAYNQQQNKIAQRLKRLVLRQRAYYKSIPQLMFAIADGVNWGIKMPGATTANYDLIADFFDSANAKKVERMRVLSQAHRRSTSNIEIAARDIRQIDAVVTAAETEYASVPNITLSTLENLLNPKELLK